MQKPSAGASPFSSVRKDLCCWIHDEKEDTLVYTSGFPTAQGCPKETIPTCKLLTTRGPPESP